MLSLIECLVCTYVYEEKKKFIKKCPKCNNSDTEQTIYLAPESEIFKNYEEKINAKLWNTKSYW